MLFEERDSALWVSSNLAFFPLSFFGRQARACETKAKAPPLFPPLTCFYRAAPWRLCGASRLFIIIYTCIFASFTRKASDAAKPLRWYQVIRVRAPPAATMMILVNIDNNTAGMTRLNGCMGQVGSFLYTCFLLSPPRPLFYTRDRRLNALSLFFFFFLPVLLVFGLDCECVASSARMKAGRSTTSAATLPLLFSLFFLLCSPSAALLNEIVRFSSGTAGLDDAYF